MPTSPYAQLRVKVNGGAPQTGDVTIAAGDTIQFDATSYDGWGVPVARWEIYSFPTGWTGPGGAWSSESVAQEDGSTYTVWYWLGNSQPPSFTAPAIEYWGKFLTRLLVNGGNKGGAPSADVEDTATMLDMDSPSGLKDLAWKESTQSGGAKKWTKDHQANLRTIDAKFEALTDTQLAWELAANATQPSVGNTVALTFLTASTMQVGQVIASSAGVYEVMNIGSAPTITVELIEDLAIAPAGTVLDGTLFAVAGPTGPTGPAGAAGANGAAGAAGAVGATGAAGNSNLYFGTFSSSNSMTPAYLDTGANVRNALNVTEYFYPIDAATTITSIAVGQKPGTNTAIHRFELYLSAAGAAFAATGRYIDIAVTAYYRLQVLASPLVCAAGDRVGMTVKLLSGSIGSAATQCVAKANYT